MLSLFIIDRAREKENDIDQWMKSFLGEITDIEGSGQSPVAEVLDEPYSQLTPLRGGAVQAGQST